MRNPLRLSRFRNGPALRFLCSLKSSKVGKLKFRKHSKDELRSRVEKQALLSFESHFTLCSKKIPGKNLSQSYFLSSIEFQKDNLPISF